MKRGNWKRKPPAKRYKTRVKRPSIPNWIKAIPESPAHGSGTFQKRLWRLVSDYTRIRDWYKYGTDVATGKRIEHWKIGQGGHFISYSHARGIFKFDVRNVHLQGAQSNKWGRREEWVYFENELKRRYGKNIISTLEEENRKTDLPISTERVILEMKKVLGLMENLPEKPDYYEKVISLC